MAKKRSTTENKIEGFAEDLGRLLGSAQLKAEGWLGQRTQIAKSLVGIRDTAAKLLSDLGHEAERVVRAGRRKKEVVQFAPQPKSKLQRRKLSARARKAISDAQKARWAKIKAREPK